MSEETEPTGFDAEETQRARVVSPAQRAIGALMGPEGRQVVVGAEIARGGMAIVRQGDQRSMLRAVAVKMAKRGDSPDHLVQEAWLTGALEHPNIVPVYDIDTASGAPIVVMKRIEGVPWQSLLDTPRAVEERFGTRDVLAWHLRILVAVCNALEYAHSQGIIHRDIKPSNVMIGKFGQVYLVDWGIAVSLSAEPDPRFPRPEDDELERLSGTPAYMAPEMALREDWAPLSVRTDVYQLGGVLFRLVAGRPPRRADNLHALLQSLRAPPDVKADWPLSDLIRRCLSSHPDDRPESVAQVRREIERWLERRGTEAIADGARVRLGELRSALTRATDDDRQAIYDLYGACRFGFEVALESWPESRVAREGLRQAVIAMTRWELAHGDDRAARVHLARLDDPPEDLSAEIEAARKAREDAAAELEQRRRDADDVSGWGARVPVGLGMLMVWVGPPVITGLMGMPDSYLRQSIVSVTTAVGTFALLPLFWPWMRHTRYNRVLVAACAMSPVLTSVFLGAAWVAGIPGDVASALRVFVFVLTTMVVTAFADVWFFPSVLGFVAALFVGAASPAWSEPALGVANLLVIANVFGLILAQRLGRSG